MRRTVLRAGPQDTVASIARRYRLSPAQVAQWNNCSVRASFDRGQRIVIYLPGKAKRSGVTGPVVAKKQSTAGKSGGKSKSTRTASKQAGAPAARTSQATGRAKGNGKVRLAADQ